MEASVAHMTLAGASPYSQSFMHNEPKLEGESADDYDARTWRHKMTVEGEGAQRAVAIPAHGLHQCFIAAAKYSKRQIPGQGKATWTKKFEAGIMILENPRLNVHPDTVDSITIYANADGVRGSNKRVNRRFPVIKDWQTTFDVWILDPIITKDVFREMVEIAGLFVGIGRFRPEKGGTNGRFQVTQLEWADNRRPLAA